MKLHWLLVLVPCLMILAACTAIPAAPRPLNVDELQQTQAVAQPNNKLALNLYAKFGATDPNANLFCSPFSIAQAFAMLGAGARGPTANQLDAFLSGGGDGAAEAAGGADVIRAYAAWGRELNGDHKEYQLRTANGIWLQKGRPFQDDFLARLKSDFGAPPQTVDFEKDPASAARDVNAWVARHTEDKIKDVLSPRSIDPRNTRLILANAIYFKGAWEHQFKKQATRPQTFHAPGGKDVEVSMMHQAHEPYPYAETDDLQLLELPYKGGELSMVILLPRKADGLAALEKSLTAEKLDGWIKQLAPRSPIVEIPKFTLRNDIDLVPPLKSMGLADVFTPDAPDFSGIDGSRQLYVAAALHAAFVNVDEVGTEAAAATVLRMGATAAPMAPLKFSADHPFMFLIRQTRTGGILFIGRVTNPPAAAS